MLLGTKKENMRLVLLELIMEWFLCLQKESQFVVLVNLLLSLLYTNTHLDLKKITATI